jgi:hypothetical protein
LPITIPTNKAKKKKKNHQTFIKERSKDKKYQIYNNKTSKIKAENKWKKKIERKEYIKTIPGLLGD